MIKLENVSKSYNVDGQVKHVLRNIDFVFESGRSLGILGKNGAGKSTLMRLMDGTQAPTSGRITRQGRISRMGLSNGFHSSLTGVENIKFVSRIYGFDYRSILPYVADFAELGDDLFTPVRTYSAGMLSRLKLGVSFAMRFDIYLIDEGTSAGDQRFQERCIAEMQSRLKTSDFIMVNHAAGGLKKWCTEAVVLNNGKFSDVMPLRKATLRHRKLMGLA